MLQPRHFEGDYTAPPRDCILHHARRIERANLFPMAQNTIHIWTEIAHFPAHCPQLTATAGVEQTPIFANLNRVHPNLTLNHSRCHIAPVRLPKLRTLYNTLQSADL